MDTQIEAKVGRRLRKSMEAALTFGAFVLAFLALTFGIADSGFVDLLNLILPIKTWLIVILVVSAVRAVFLWINGKYRDTLRVRQLLSMLTLGLVWLPLVSSFTLDMILGGIAEGNDMHLYPRVILGPLVAGAGVLVLFALTALEEAANKNGTRAA